MGWLEDKAKAEKAAEALASPVVEKPVAKKRELGKFFSKCVSPMVFIE